MVFSSAEFLLLFLPVTLFVYFIFPKKHLKWRNIVLLVMSLLFYGWGEPLYVILMVASVCASYFFGIMIGKYLNTNKPVAKRWLTAGIIFNLALLGFFKYYDFIMLSLSEMPFLSFLRSAVLGVRLPIGISFYTFQIMSYIIDVYRGDAPTQKNLATFGTYVTLFPQLIAGPIVKYHDVDKQLTEREHNISLFAKGVRTFIAGLAKKVLLANSAAKVFDSLQEIPGGERTLLGAWLGIIMFAFQIYFDFSAYSDMAIGLGRMFGFEFIENFNYPYISKSITEFWRRWHISLSTWFKEYLYIPLGGNRKGKLRSILNLLAVWAATGIWHGASWNFLFWGLYYFIFLVIEKNFLKKLLDKIPSFLSHIYTSLVVLIGWVLFTFTDISECFSWIGNMFGVGISSIVSPESQHILIRSLLLLVILMIGATPLPKKLYKKYIDSRKDIVGMIFTLIAFVILIICISYVATSGYNPFLYSRF